MPDFRRARIRVIAGTGVSGGAGDGGPARLAELFSPVAICLDEDDHLFISDHNTFSVRRIDADSGVITTVAGGMADQPEELGGLEFDACEQVLSDGLPAVCAALEASALVAREGRLILALPDENRVRFVDLVSGRLYTLAGTGEPGFGGDGGPALTTQLNEPCGICIDPAGNLYVADAQNDRIRRIDAHSGLVTTVAGGGGELICEVRAPVLALEAELLRPSCVLANPLGELIVGGQAGVFRLDLHQGVIGPLVEGSGACDELTLGVDAMACDREGNLFFASSVSQAIWLLAHGAGELVRVVGSGCLGSECQEQTDATAFDLASPRGLAMSGDGVLYFTDAGIYQAFRVEFD